MDRSQVLQLVASPRTSLTQILVSAEHARDSDEGVAVDGWLSMFVRTRIKRSRIATRVLHQHHLVSQPHVSRMPVSKVCINKSCADARCLTIDVNVRVLELFAHVGQ